MADQFKVKEDSSCISCVKIPPQDDCLQCFDCKDVFHVSCQNIVDHSKIGTQTLVRCFRAQSTKSNFKFYCDKCNTKAEIERAETESAKIKTLEVNFNKMEAKLDEIKRLLTKVEGKPGTRNVKETTKPSKPTLWDDKERFDQIKVNMKSKLVIKNNEQRSKENQTIVEKAIMENDIPVVHSSKKESGDIAVVCESKEKRDELKNIVTSTNKDIVVESPKEFMPAVTIVGLPQKYTEEEIIRLLVTQNNHLKKFAVSNDMNEHIKINSVKELKNNSSVFQAFANVSIIMREGLRDSKDKVTIGLSSCKVYDRYYIKRCYNCQRFGHYHRDCKTKDVHNCGKCGEEHPTKDCNSEIRKCINCVREKLDDVSHSANSHQCPCIINQKNLVKKKMSGDHLNSNRTNTWHHR